MATVLWLATPEGRSSSWSIFLAALPSGYSNSASTCCSAHFWDNKTPTRKIKKNRQVAFALAFPFGAGVFVNRTGFSVCFSSFEFVLLFSFLSFFPLFFSFSFFSFLSFLSFFLSFGLGMSPPPQLVNAHTRFKSSHQLKNLPNITSARLRWVAAGFFACFGLSSIALHNISAMCLNWMDNWGQTHMNPSILCNFIELQYTIGTSASRYCTSTQLLCRWLTNLMMISVWGWVFASLICVQNGELLELVLSQLNNYLLFFGSLTTARLLWNTAVAKHTESATRKVLVSPLKPLLRWILQCIAGMHHSLYFFHTKPLHHFRAQWFFERLSQELHKIWMWQNNQWQTSTTVA